MAIDDSTSYELTGAQVKDLANKIKAKAADNTFVGATSAAPGSKGLVPQPQAGDQEKVLHGDGSWKNTTAKLVEMSYGESGAWAKFISAYNAGSIVYCRASSNSNPATGTQGRKAFMAYVNNATTPTEVEFQYVRSVSTKTDSQQGDQVFVYKLTNASGGTWTVTTRNMSAKINVSGPITKTFVTGANATVTIGANAMTGATSSAAGTAGIVPAPASGDQNKVLKGDGTWGAVTNTNIDWSTLGDQSSYIDLGTIRICFGSVTVTDIPTGAFGEKAHAITFPASFASTPMVFAQVGDMAGGCGEYVSPSGVSTSGATLWCGHAGSTSATSASVSWLAIGAKS